jgi:hypothetical protein
MRSKWLDWTPDAGSVGFDGSRSGEFPITQAGLRDKPLIPTLSPGTIIEEVSAGEPTKPTDRASALCRERMEERPTYFWGKRVDTYGWRAHAALDAICQIPAPAGLIVWLGKHSPFLHARLTRDLPNEISRAWDAQIAYEDFDALCFELVTTYCRAAELYRR